MVVVRVFDDRVVSGANMNQHESQRREALRCRLTEASSDRHTVRVIIAATTAAAAAASVRSVKWRYWRKQRKTP